MKSKRSLLILVLMALLVILANQLTDYFTTEITDTVILQQNTPDYSMENFRVTSLHPDGSLYYKLAADSMQHFPATEETRLARPSLTLHQAPDTRWQVQANAGELYQLEQKVVLHGQVEVRREKPAPAPPVVLQTETLYLYPERAWLETRDAIAVQSGASRVEAVGMQADLERETIDLLSRVRATYVPPR